MVEPDVDRKRSGDGNPSYVSGPELGWRGTGRGRPTGPLLQRRRPYWCSTGVAIRKGVKLKAGRVCPSGDAVMRRGSGWGDLGLRITWVKQRGGVGTEPRSGAH